MPIVAILAIQLLEVANHCDRQTATELLPLFYDELRLLAVARMAGEKPDHTLDATALVHEAYLRLTGERSFESRRHFLRAAAVAMRRILIDHAAPTTPSNAAAVGASKWMRNTMPTQPTSA